MGSLKDDLLAPDRSLIETHISWVFVGESEVWKVKKPVDLGFLDFTTAELRRQACEAELRLNRRLAPDVYLGVVPIIRDASGAHRLGGSDGSEPVDWAVHMTRLADADRAEERLAAGRLDVEQVERIAGHLAAFHERARCDEQTARYGMVATIARNTGENFAQTRDTIGEHLTAAEAGEIEAWQSRFLTHNALLFKARIDAGRVRDGHGDLRLEHVYVTGDGAVTVVDCIEFNERFRFADVCADVAFLAMDLAWHGRVDLAERFLAAYAREANDYDLYPLVDFYESYRAYVRGKIAAMLASNAQVDTTTRDKAAGEARRYFLLALATERRSLLPPSVVAVGGLIASGKSTVAGSIAAELSAPAIDADRTRKFQLGVAARDPVHVPAWQGAYSSEVTEQVYAEIFRRAGAVLSSGRPVVLDASFRSRRHREAAKRLAEDHGVPFHFVECRAPLDVLEKRLERRAREAGVSDGRLEILSDFAASWQDVEDLEAGEHLVLDTAQPLESSIETLRHELGAWPAGFNQ